jgi:hypothetical protein
VPTPEERYQRWVRWIDRIRDATYSLFHYRRLWTELPEMTEAANLPPSTIFDAFGVWYATTQQVAVRRQVDRRRDTVSLRRLLEDIAANPGVATRQRHLAAWGGDEDFSREAHRNFDRFAGEGRNTINRAMVREDITALENAAAIVKRYADEAIAHMADDIETQVPTFGELNDTIDTIGELVKKYVSLLQAVWLVELVPVIQEDWKAPFRRPWLQA